MKRLKGKKYLKFVKWQKRKKSKKKLIFTLHFRNFDINNHTLSKLDSNTRSKLNFQNLKNILACDFIFIKKYIQEHKNLTINFPNDSTFNMMARKIKIANVNHRITNQQVSNTINENSRYPINTDFNAMNVIRQQADKAISAKITNDFIDKAKEIEEKLQPTNKILRDNRKFSLIAGVFQEAIANTCEHAYNTNDNDKMIEIYQGMHSRIGKIWIMVVDYGKTIPGTIRDKARQKKAWHQRVLLRFADNDTLNDAKLIEFALQEGKTSQSEDAGRGQGLYDIINTTQNLPEASLRIYSGHGSYSIPENKSKKLSEKFPGTLIYWEFDIKHNI